MTPRARHEYHAILYVEGVVVLGIFCVIGSVFLK